MKRARLEDLHGGSVIRPWHPSINKQLPRLVVLGADDGILRVVYGLFTPQPIGLPEAPRDRIRAGANRLREHIGYLLCGKSFGTLVQVELCAAEAEAGLVFEKTGVVEIAFTALIRMPAEIAFKRLGGCDLWLNDLPPRHLPEALNNGLFEFQKEERRFIRRGDVLTRENWNGVKTGSRAIRLLHGAPVLTWELEAETTELACLACGQASSLDGWLDNLENCPACGFHDARVMQVF